MTYSPALALGMFSIGSAVYWLPSLLVILSCGWILSDAVAGRTKDEWPVILEPARRPVVINIPEVEPQGKRTVWIGLPMVMALGIAGGYAIRDHQLVNNTHTYFDVEVLEQYSPDKYLLQPARMQPWISKTCTPVDLSKGHTMKFYTFEQMTDCHRVKSFEFYANSKGERINASISDRIQMR